MSKIQLTKNSNEEVIRAYFTNILSVSKSNKEYPVSLEEVWPLVYERKDHAVRALKQDFMEGIDYQALPKNGEQDCWGGSNRVDYMITVSCMEYLIARKIRPVFEVYRQVFHKAALAMPQTFAEALRLAADQQEQIERQQMLISEKENSIKLLKEENADLIVKATYLDMILSSNEELTATQIASDYGMSAKAFNKLLSNLRIQRKVNGQWCLYSAYLDRKWTTSRTNTFKRKDGSIGTNNLTVWTIAGRCALYNILKNNGFLPLVEQEEKEDNE